MIASYDNYNSALSYWKSHNGEKTRITIKNMNTNAFAMYGVYSPDGKLVEMFDSYSNAYSYRFRYGGDAYKYPIKDVATGKYAVK